jgi:hypothetical protein
LIRIRRWRFLCHWWCSNWWSNGHHVYTFSPNIYPFFSTHWPWMSVTALVNGVSGNGDTCLCLCASLCVVDMMKVVGFCETLRLYQQELYFIGFWAQIFSPVAKHGHIT